VLARDRVLILLAQTYQIYRCTS